MTPETLRRVVDVYAGSDGRATVALYEELIRMGPAGQIAVDLFRAQKNSSRAKVYRGRAYRDLAYGRKNWAIGNLCSSLGKRGEALGINWGWKQDEKSVGYPWALYVDLPEGQVSFHAEKRLDGPDYAGDWDGSRASSERVVEFCASLLDLDGRHLSSAQLKLQESGA